MRHQRLVFGALLALVLALLFGATMQRDINGSNDTYVIDTGEFQNVAAQWGTGHPTGYPLYSLSVAAFANTLRLVGIPPALGGSVLSVVLAILTFVGLAIFLGRLGVAPPIAAVAALVPAGTLSIWVFAVVADVRAMLLFLLVVAYLTASQWWRDRRPGWLYALALVMGFAVGHHRLAVLALPALLIFVAPLLWDTLRTRARRLVIAAVLFPLPFLIYLYLPLRGWMGGPWVYGQPTTWRGFWDIVLAREYTALMQPASTPVGFADNVSYVASTLQSLMPWLILLASVAGLVIGLIPHPLSPSPTRGEGEQEDNVRRWAALSVLALVAANLVFALLWPRAVYLPATLMPSLLALPVGLALLADVAARWIGARTSALVGNGLAVAVLLLAIIPLAWTNGPQIAAITHDGYGRDLIQRVAAAHFAPPPSGPIIMAPWGREYFALTYGKEMGDLPPLDIVDHRANMEALVASGRPLLAVSPTFYTFPLAWWDKRLKRAYLSSADGGLVRVANRPALTDADVPAGQTAVPMGPISLRGWRVTPVDDGKAWRVSLYWQANEKPKQDYSVFVHLSDQDRITSPDAIIAQADRSAPVDGWYPTSRWSAGEIVRDDYVVAVPEGRDARLISVGLYTSDGAGGFQNLGVVDIPLPS
ncbi:MAG: DUF2723 domain-containing protein [Anaerolineae bacterium]